MDSATSNTDQRYSGLSAMLVPIRAPLLVVAHIVIFATAYWIAFVLRFDFRVPEQWREVYLGTLPWLLAIQLGCFFCFRTFSGWWRYFTFRDLVSLSYPLVASFLLFVCVDLFVFETYVPRSVHIMNLVVAGTMIGGLRSVWRLTKEGVLPRKLPVGCDPAFIICNDSDSAILAYQINNRTNSSVRLIGILTDNEASIGGQQAGMRVLGSPMAAPDLAHGRGVKQVWVIAGDVDGRRLNQLKQLYDQHDLSLKVVQRNIDPDATNGRIPLREIDINDLLHRDPVKLDTELIAAELQGKRVLVTGAGGSIGSELCRQLLKFRPAELVLLDHRENSVFMIHHELAGIAADQQTTLLPTVGDILDQQRMRHLFDTYRPQFVYHAAAHKHVGLMELNSGEAIKNNIDGTRRIAEIADEFEVQKFVLISTDKAVNPTSVMGCTKHLAERFVLALAEESETAFVVVRFGNVLGSNGSVVPLFKEQIARGGPVTLTDPRMTRFFMTIPEASQLVLQAASMGSGGQIFVLDMGEQVKVLELAKTMIRLAGLPEESIEIETVGMRPGEKLYEELHIDPDQLLETDHPKVNAAWQASEPLHEIAENIDSLVALAYHLPDRIRNRLHELIPEYHDGRDDSISSNQQSPVLAARNNGKAN